MNDYDPIGRDPSQDEIGEGIMSECQACGFKQVSDGEKFWDYIEKRAQEIKNRRTDADLERQLTEAKKHHSCDNSIKELQQQLEAEKKWKHELQRLIDSGLDALEAERAKVKELELREIGANECVRIREEQIAQLQQYYNTALDELRIAFNKIDERDALIAQLQKRCESWETAGNEWQAQRDIEMQKRINLEAKVKEWQDISGSLRGQLNNAESAVIENNSLRDEIAQLEAKVKELEARLKAEYPQVLIQQIAQLQQENKELTKQLIPEWVIPQQRQQLALRDALIERAIEIIDHLRCGHEPNDYQQWLADAKKVVK